MQCAVVDSAHASNKESACRRLHTKLPRLHFRLNRLGCFLSLTTEAFSPHKSLIGMEYV